MLTKRQVTDLEELIRRETTGAGLFPGEAEYWLRRVKLDVLAEEIERLMSTHGLYREIVHRNPHAVVMSGDEEFRNIASGAMKVVLAVEYETALRLCRDLEDRTFRITETEGDGGRKPKTGAFRRRRPRRKRSPESGVAGLIPEKPSRTAALPPVKLNMKGKNHGLHRTADTGPPRLRR